MQFIELTHLFKELFQNRGDIVRRILGQVHLLLLCFKGLAELLDPGLGPANAIHTLRQRQAEYRL